MSSILKGKEEGYNWEIILCHRQNWNSPLIDQEGFVSAEKNYAYIWRSKKDYQEYIKQKTINDKFLATELQKAKQAYEISLANAKALGASDRQLRKDFSQSYARRVIDQIPYRTIFDKLVAKVAIDPENFRKLAEKELERFMLEKKASTETIVPLFDPSKIFRGYQPALKITWKLEFNWFQKQLESTAKV
jgi:hypothetical protein